VTCFLFVVYTRVYFFTYIKEPIFLKVYMCLYFNLYINTGTNFLFIYTHVYIFTHS